MFSVIFPGQGSQLVGMCSELYSNFKLFKNTFEEADEILKAAADDLDTSNDLYRYTKDLRDNFDADERLKLIEMIWEVVYADGVLHDFEATLMRRLAGLLYVDDRDSGEAKKRVMHKFGLQD